VPPPASLPFPQWQPDARIPPRPTDPRAAKAYRVFDAYCARCHQTGKLERPVPAAGFGNILALGDVAADAGRVMPGVPDASLLYRVLAQGHKSPELARDIPGPDDIMAVRIWLRELPAKPQHCAGRKPIRPAAAESFIEEALRAEREGARDLRFVSLIVLYNACVSSEDLAAARHGIAKLLNSLSSASEPHPLNAVDPDGTILSFRLQDLGWTASQWQVLETAYPKALVLPLSNRTRALAGAANPVLRGDWLANAADDPKLYYQLLGIPLRLADLAKTNGVDIDANVRLNRARRATLRASAVTRGNRVAERHPSTRGGFWIIYDFGSSAGVQDLFERPLGPKAHGANRTPFKPDGLRVLFTLPNGFLAYALYDPSGLRVDKTAPGVAAPMYPGAKDVHTAGVGCFSCHAGGVKPFRDGYRAHALAADPLAPGKEIRDAALALAATDGEVLLLSNADNERYRNALVAAGVDPALTLAGDEPVTALSRRYASGNDFAGAARELDLDPQTFAAALSKATGNTALLTRRLEQTRRPRAEIDQLFAYLKGVSEPRPEEAARKPAAQASAPTPGRIELEMWVDEPHAALGDVISVTVQSNTDCYLTVINVDASGSATVVFPNDFEADNLLTAGKPVRVPGVEAPYQFKRKEAGRELMLARCSTSPAPPTGVEHEFSRQRFTLLGNWESFVEDALQTEADLRSNPLKAEKARAARAAAMRRNVGTRGTAGTVRADTAAGRTLQDGHAVAVIE
jgi:mono/diheme cytochrome c family protein